MKHIYVARPCVVEALRIVELATDDQPGVCVLLENGDTTRLPHIPVLHGDVKVGDYIVTHGSNGEVHTVQRESFERWYTPVQEVV